MGRRRGQGEARSNEVTVEIGDWFVELEAAMNLAEADAGVEGGAMMGAGDERA